MTPPALRSFRNLLLESLMGHCKHINQPDKQQEYSIGTICLQLINKYLRTGMRRPSSRGKILIARKPLAWIIMHLFFGISGLEIKDVDLTDGHGLNSTHSGQGEPAC